MDFESPQEVFKRPASCNTCRHLGQTAFKCPSNEATTLLVSAMAFAESWTPITVVDPQIVPKLLPELQREAENCELRSPASSLSVDA